MSPRHRESSGWVESLQALLSTLVIALFIITFAVQAFQIPSASMEKTLLVGDYLFVDKLHFGDVLLQRFRLNLPDSGERES